GKHIAEQPHAQRHRLGGVLDAIQKKVEWCQKQAGNSGRMERRRKEFFDKAARMLDLDAVIEHQEQHAQRHAHGHVQVGRRQNSVVIKRIAVLGAQACHLENPCQEIDGHQVKQVHEDDPQEHSQGQRRNKAARDLAGNNAFSLLFDHVDHHFDKCLETAWYTCVSQLCGAPHQEDDHKTCKNGPEQGVVVDEAEIGDGRLLGTNVIQVNQVMLNILRLWRKITSSHL